MQRLPLSTMHKLFPLSAMHKLFVYKLQGKAKGNNTMLVEAYEIKAVEEPSHPSLPRPLPTVAQG